MTNLIELFRSLEPIAAIYGDNQFSTTLIPGHEQHRLGKDAQDRPLLLISVRDAPSQRQPAPIVLEHLTVAYNQNCRVSRPNNTLEEGRFTVVRLYGRGYDITGLFPQSCFHDPHLSQKTSNSIRYSSRYEPAN